MKPLAELIKHKGFLNEKTSTLKDYGIIAYRILCNKVADTYVYLKLNESREDPVADMKYETVVIRKSDC